MKDIKEVTGAFIRAQGTCHQISCRPYHASNSFKPLIANAPATKCYNNMFQQNMKISNEIKNEISFF